MSIYIDWYCYFKIAEGNLEVFIYTFCRKNYSVNGQGLRAHSVHFKKKFELHSQFFVWSLPLYQRVKLPKISGWIVAQKNSEQATCFQAFFYRKCMKNIGKNGFFANIGCQVHLNPNISSNKCFWGYWETSKKRILQISWFKPD